ncbi:hypothetical protein OG747_36670 [Streptomyces sp. NBC_01384]|uniref:hypothetical protein n=1 Tax=Streptomyces sp. NBC_01384 TaxID=2903847 RepID=UPI00324B2E3B
MYRIAIVRKGQPADRRTCTTLGELRDIVWEVVRAEGSVITDADHGPLMELTANARNMADNEGFAALEFGGAAITIRPGPAPTPTFPGGGF